MSAQTGSDSSVTSNFVSDILFKLFFKDIISHADFMYIFATPIRKLAHFSEFMILAILVYTNLKEYKVRNIVLISIVLSAIYALSDELHQLFVPNRHCSISDVVIDIIGVIIGVVLIHLHER